MIVIMALRRPRAAQHSLVKLQPQHKKVKQDDSLLRLQTTYWMSEDDDEHEDLAAATLAALLASEAAAKEAAQLSASRIAPVNDEVLVAFYEENIDSSPTLTCR